jgi:hypothetical protein
MRGETVRTLPFRVIGQNARTATLFGHQAIGTGMAAADIVGKVVIGINNIFLIKVEKLSSEILVLSFFIKTNLSFVFLNK